MQHVDQQQNSPLHLALAVQTYDALIIYATRIVESLAGHLVSLFQLRRYISRPGLFHIHHSLRRTTPPDN
jgi:hypothetical protein